MLRERTNIDSLSEFVRYLAQHEEANGEQLPPLSGLSRELGVSIASLREQLEVARALGLVEVKPRYGIMETLANIPNCAIISKALIGTKQSNC